MFGPSIKNIKFDTFGWEITNSTKDIFEWRSQDNTSVISINFYNQSPDLPCSLDNITELRKYFMKSINSFNGAMIHLDVINIQGYNSLDMLFKSNTNKGMIFVYSIIIPFKNFSYTIKAQSIESSPICIRDNVILDRLLSENKVIINDNNEISGWFDDDIYEIQYGNLKTNKSDNIIYDNEFPEHPLSIVRNSIKSIKDSIIINKKLEKYEKF